MTQARPCGPILVVDDDEAQLDLLCELLRGEGYDLIAFSTGSEAAESEIRPALAVLDVCLPGVSGYELCRRLRAAYGSSVPILFVSGERTEAVDRVAGLLLGGDDYLVKPFAPDELLARVRGLLRRHESAPAAPPLLTPREQQVLELLAGGLSNVGIAGELVISPKTVATHIAHIYEKLGVGSRVEALTAGYRNELLPLLERGSALAWP